MRRFLAPLVLTAAILSAGSASAHEDLAFFEYGSADLQADGYSTARNVVFYASMPEWANHSVIINAHLDTAEADEFSNELALRRAQAMASELVVLGINPARICMFGHAATRPIRPTHPHTREPLNRYLNVGMTNSPRPC